MRILKASDIKGTLIPVQLEEHDSDIYMVATFPIAPTTRCGHPFLEEGRAFRCEFEFDDLGNAKEAYDNIASRNKSMLDYSDHLIHKHLEQFIW